MLPKHEKSNRYYDGILDKLTEEEKRSSISSIFLRLFFQYFPSLSALECNKEEYLFKEDFLLLSDYLKAFAHSVRVFLVRPPAIKVRVFNLADQIMEELGLFGDYAMRFRASSIFLLPSVLEKKESS